MVPVLILEIRAIFKNQLLIYEEVKEFAEAVHYRDFSRRYNEKQGSEGIRLLKHNFNEISTTFKALSKEKENQQQYLQKILELINTGILSYELGSGKVIWLNEAAKNILQAPYLPTIERLNQLHPLLFKEIEHIAVGESKIGSVQANNNSTKLLISAAEFKTDNKNYKLLAFQNINEALDETEAKAWQKLLSVLTHEIMNSIAPISSLAETLKNELQSLGSNYQEGELDDMILGMGTIKRRSEGLLKFAEIYRSLNKISKADFKEIYVRDLFENLYHLLQPSLKQKNIELEIVLKDSKLALNADPALLEQVLINLLLNAMDAVKEREHAKIILSSGFEKGKAIIKVSDNGAGMKEEVAEKIFVPFFTTKKNGSGIGLTLCKQIMMLHHGNIQMNSKENIGSSVTLTF